MLLLAIGLMLFQGALSARLQQPNVTHPHWPLHAVVQVWVDQRNSPPGGAELAERAMRTWTTASGGRLTLQRTLVHDKAQIQILFAPGGANYGETLPHVNRATGLIDGADVSIASDVPADAMTKQIVAYLTALHELGHAIGLEHTTNFSDIMYLFRYPDDGPRYFGNYRARLHSAADIGGAEATGLSAYDVTALRALYGD